MMFIMMILACLTAMIIGTMVCIILFTNGAFMKFYMNWVMKQSGKLVDSMFDEDEEIL